MKRLIIFLAPFFIALFVVVGIVIILKNTSGKGALQVTSIPGSDVYLNGTLIGKTPLCKCENKDMIPVGMYSLKLVPSDFSLTPYEEKIQIGKSVLTVVDRTFGQGGESSGSVITLSPTSEKNASLLVISFPSDAKLFLDSNETAKTPALLKSITESDHEILLRKDGYNDKTVRIRGVAGYKLTAEVFLGINPDLANQQASPSAKAEISPTPALSKVEILKTPTVYLNVRDTNSLNGAIVGKVNPGELYVLLDEKDGWYQIQLAKDKTGWVSNQYAQKQ